VISAELAPDGVGRIDPVVVPVGDRRDRERRQREFPEIPEKDSEKEPPEAESDHTPADPPARSHDRPASPEAEDDDRTIDLLVLGLILPRRQQLPGGDLSALLH
jgi:hypothetical protein